MTTILAWLLSFTDTVQAIIMWSDQHEFAASLLGILIANLAYKFMPHGGIGNDIYDVLRATFQRRRLEKDEKGYVSIFLLVSYFAALGVLLICMIFLQACSTASAVRSGQTDFKSLATAVCQDLETTITAASALVAWTEPYFPKHRAEWVMVEELLKTAESARDAMCSSVALVVDADSYQTLLSKRTEIVSTITKINQAVAKIKNVSAAVIDREFEDYKLGLEHRATRPFGEVVMLLLPAETDALSAADASRIVDVEMLQPKMPEALSFSCMWTC